MFINFAYQWFKSSQICNLIFIYIGVLSYKTMKQILNQKLTTLILNSVFLKRTAVSKTFNSMTKRRQDMCKGLSYQWFLQVSKIIYFYDAVIIHIWFILTNPIFKSFNFDNLNFDICYSLWIQFDRQKNLAIEWISR